MTMYMTTYTARQLKLLGHSYRQMKHDPDLERFKHGGYRVRSEGYAANDPLAQHIEKLDGTDLVVDGVLSHGTAAVLHGLCAPYAGLSRLEILRPPGKGHWPFKSRNVVARIHELAQDEIVLLNNHKITSLARTVLDLARTWPATWAVAAGDMALRQGLRLIDLEHRLEQESQRPRSGQVRWVVENLDGRAESPGESISRVYMLQAGLPRPQIQRVFVRAGRRYQSDFFFDDERGGVIGEFDGELKYSEPGMASSTALYQEKIREDDLREEVAGFVRWGWADLQQPDGFLGRISRALGVRHRPLGPRPRY